MGQTASTTNSDFGRASRVLGESALLSSESGGRMQVLNYILSKVTTAREFMAKYEDSKRIEDLEQGISLFRDALTLCPPDYPDLRISITNRIANAHYCRFEDNLGNADDIEQCVSLYRQILKLRPPGHPDRSKTLDNLAASLNLRYHNLGNAKDIEDSVLLHREALSLRPPGNPDHSLSLNNLASALGTRYHIVGNAQDLTECILLQRKALDLHPPGHPYRSRSINSLARALNIRYEKLGNASDIEECIILHQDALGMRPPGHPDRSVSLTNLAGALSSRYRMLDNAKDLEGAVILYRVALNLLHPGHRSYSMALNNLAAILITRYNKLGHPKDLEDSISLQHEALRTCSLPPDHPDRSFLLNNLSSALNSRHLVLENADDLEESILSQRKALSLCPPGHPHRPLSLSNLATALENRYNESHNLEDLEECISLRRDAFSLRPLGHPYRCVSLSSFANNLRIRYANSGNTEDLEEIILLHHEELDLRPLGHPNRSISLGSLARDLNSRYNNLGNPKDLEDSILLHREALSLQDHCPDHQRSIVLNSLAVALSARYRMLDSADDLDESISLHREALKGNPPGGPAHSLLSSNLAGALNIRYEKSGNPDDLEESISLHRSTINSFPPGQPMRSAPVNNLASVLHNRYAKYGDAKDLDESISLFCEAFNLLPPGHPDRSNALNSLSGIFQTLYNKFRNPVDLENSILIQRNAITLCPPSHPHRAMLHCRLGDCHIIRRVQSNEREDLLQALLCYSLAADDSTSYLPYRLRGADSWVYHARASQHETMFSAYTALLQLVSRCLIFRPSVEAQQRFLASANIPQSLASDAASAAIEAGNIELAVEFLEQGRAVLWSRADAYKYPLQQLRQVKDGEKLADRLEILSAELERLSFSNNSAMLSQETSGGAAIFDNQMKEHHVLSEEWEDLVEKVRKIEGFDSFLQAAPFHTLQSASEEGPVTLVNISKHRSDAIILLKNRRPELVNLPEVLLPELQSQKCGSAKEIARTLAYLWDSVVSPIVDKLKELEIPKGSRIWWCPTGALCALPIHAAGRGKRTLQDMYISSYTSTLSSLIRARSTNDHPPTIPKLLVVGQPSTDLKRVEDEVDIIKKLVPGVDILFGPEANREAVLESLKEHSWVHFACHGILGEKDQPFQTSFKLHEDPNLRLHLLDLIRARLPNAELAFLSACHSAAGGLSTPDENIHLSAALQFCGFKSVIGTLWEMDDEDGPTISEKFYQQMFRNSDKPDFRDSARALNLAIKEMKKAGVPPERFAMFVHIGA